MEVNMFELQYNYLPKDIKQVVDGINANDCLIGSKLNFLKLWNLIADRLKPYLYSEKYFSCTGCYYCGIEYDELLEICNENIELSLLSYICRKELKPLNIKEYVEKIYNEINNFDSDDKYRNFLTRESNLKKASAHYNEYSERYKKIENVDELLVWRSPLSVYFLLERFNDERNKPVNKMTPSKFCAYFKTAVKTILEQNIELEIIKYPIINKEITMLIDAIEFEGLYKPHFYVDLCKFYLKYKNNEAYSDKECSNMLFTLSQLQCMPNILFGTDFVLKIADYIVKYDSNKSYKIATTFAAYISGVVFKILEIVYVKSICNLVLDNDSLKHQILDKIYKNKAMIGRIKEELKSIEKFFNCSESNESVTHYNKIPFAIDLSIRSRLRYDFSNSEEYMFYCSSDYVTFWGIDCLNHHVENLEKIFMDQNIFSERIKANYYFYKFPYNDFYVEYMQTHHPNG